MNSARNKVLGGFQEFIFHPWLGLAPKIEIATRPLSVVAIKILTIPNLPLILPFQSLRQLLAAALLEAVRSNSVQAGHETWSAEKSPN